jgi:hypothetical protein
VLKYFIVTAVLLVALIAVIAIKPNLVFAVNGKQVAYSLNREVRAESTSCVRTRPDAWTCYAEWDPGSGADSTYTLRMPRADCWTAVRTDGHLYRRHASGCIKESDFYPRQIDSLFD